MTDPRDPHEAGGRQACNLTRPTFCELSYYFHLVVRRSHIKVRRDIKIHALPAKASESDPDAAVDANLRDLLIVIRFTVSPNETKESASDRSQTLFEVHD